MSYVMDETEEGINIDNTQHDLELDRDLDPTACTDTRR